MIAGPTGIGKTDLAVALAQRLQGELISCDSVQVYRGLEIGANKTPTSVPQLLLDVVDWREPFTAADFLHHCTLAIKEVTGRGKVPILVGGTGFYLDWVIEGRPGAPATDPEAMKALELELAGVSWEDAFSKLITVDPKYAQALMKNDWYRLRRALVVHRMTGRPLSSFPIRQNSSTLTAASGDPIEWRCFYLSFNDRFALLRHLDRRCEAMIQRGLIDEVLALRAQGFSLNCQAGRSIGYQETLQFLSSIERGSPILPIDAGPLFVNFIQTFQAQTRQYTRRQEKWFHARSYYHWLERAQLTLEIDPELVDRVVSMFELSQIEFDHPNHPLVMKGKQFRDRCRSDEKTAQEKRRQLRSYQSQLSIFKDSAYRVDFLKKTLNRDC